MNPTIAETMFRMAVEKALTVKQREAWELFNYDRMTEEEIARKLRISRRSTRSRLDGAKYSIKMWCEANMHIYDLIKSQQQEESDL
jgi:DNA-directed RNA polymerase specialized sigma24 family protein